MCLGCVNVRARFFLFVLVCFVFVVSTYKCCVCVAILNEFGCCVLFLCFFFGVKAWANREFAL